MCENMEKYERELDNRGKFPFFLFAGAQLLKEGALNLKEERHKINCNLL
jgi:hypothetical protein